MTLDFVEPLWLWPLEVLYGCSHSGRPRTSLCTQTHTFIHAYIHRHTGKHKQKTEKQQRKSDLNSYFHARDTKSTREHKQGDPIWSNTHRLAWCSDSHQCFLSWFESSRSEIAGGRRKRGEPPHLFWLQQHWWLKQQWLRDTTLTHRESRWTKCMATTERWWLCVRERRERDEKGKEKKGRAGDEGGGQDERDGCASAWWALQVEHRCSTIAGVL